MKRNYDNVIKSIKHLKKLHSTFLNKNHYSDINDYLLYKENSDKLKVLLSLPEVQLHKQLYDAKSRQMILADILEYIFLARGFFFITDGANSIEKKKQRIELFIKIILHFVNLLMNYESMTVDNKLRKKYLEEIAKSIPEIQNEDLYQDVLNFSGKIGLPQEDSKKEAQRLNISIKTMKSYNKYFDKILPKTAGGLWHELLVYIFLLRNDLGYIVPLLLHQKFISGSDTLVPPDFLIITKDKNIYGIEVGIKKEIQSGTFSLMTNIPTATIDTINSRCSDRCPICKKWILFCPYVIENYSNLDKNIKDAKKPIKCLEIECPHYNRDEILKGKCLYTKYSRNSSKSINHKFTNGLHYHYRCVLENLSRTKKDNLISTEDTTAIKTHYPYYAGLEMLFD